MQIPKELLEEKNYEGTRLIELNDAKVIELQAKLKELQLEANPFLSEMEAMTPEMDPIYSELQTLEVKKQELQKQLAPIREKYDVPLQQVQKIEQKAQLIKDKIQPRVLKAIEKELGEFEQARNLNEKDGKIFVEVVDVIEEEIKKIRANKK